MQYVAFYRIIVCLGVCIPTAVIIFHIIYYTRLIISELKKDSGISIFTYLKLYFSFAIRIYNHFISLPIADDFIFVCIRIIVVGTSAKSECKCNQCEC